MTSGGAGAPPATGKRAQRHEAPSGADFAQVVIDTWAAEHPGVDVTTKLLAVRLRRVAHHLERALRRELALYDTELWELEVLHSLRHGDGCRKGAGELLKEAQVTSGAITNRIDRLERRGWVRRDVDPDDRRQVIVTLTPEGLRRADELLALKTAAEQRLFSALDRPTQSRIAEDLKLLLLELEGPAEPAPGSHQS